MNIPIKLSLLMLTAISSASFAADKTSAAANTLPALLASTPAAAAAASAASSTSDTTAALQPKAVSGKKARHQVSKKRNDEKRAATKAEDAKKEAETKRISKQALAHLKNSAFAMKAAGKKLDTPITTAQEALDQLNNLEKMLNGAMVSMQAAYNAVAAMPVTDESDSSSAQAESNPPLDN